jgi:hypothetical protein
MALRSGAFVFVQVGSCVGREGPSLLTIHRPFLIIAAQLW